MARRYFEFVEGTTSDFWEVWLEKNEVRTRYGTIGAAGDTTVTAEGSEAAARTLHDKLVREKLGKGYREKAGGAAGPSSERVTAPMGEFKPKP
jgi:predicted DNA-binding WGR domain protein